MSISTIQGNGARLHTHPIAAGEYYGKPSGCAVTAIIRDGRNPGFDSDYERKASAVMDSIILGMKPTARPTTHPSILAPVPKIILPPKKTTTRCRRYFSKPYKTLEDVQNRIQIMVLPETEILPSNIRLRSKQNAHCDSLEVSYEHKGVRLHFFPVDGSFDFAANRLYWSEIVNAEIRRRRASGIKESFCGRWPKRRVEDIQKILQSAALPEKEIKPERIQVHQKKNKFYVASNVRFRYKDRYVFTLTHDGPCDIRKTKKYWAEEVNKVIRSRRK